MGFGTTVTLGRFYFRKAGTADVVESAYSMPSNDDDPRLLSFGEVPPIVFSETFNALAKVAGRKGDEPHK